MLHRQKRSNATYLGPDEVVGFFFRTRFGVGEGFGVEVCCGPVRLRMGPGVGVGVELVPGGLVVPGGWLVGGGGFLDGRGGTGGFCFGFWPGGL